MRSQKGELREHLRCARDVFTSDPPYFYLQDRDEQQPIEGDGYKPPYVSAMSGLYSVDRRQARYSGAFTCST